MTHQVKLKVRVYSDRQVKNPEAYFNATFGNYSPFWNLVPSDNPNCILCETMNTYNPDTDDLASIYDRITPEMYQSTSRSYSFVTTKR